MAWKQVERGFADTTYEGPYPARLYRYRSLNASNFEERLEQELTRREIFLAAVSDLNDPDEGNIHFEIRGTDREITRFWIDRMAADIPTSAELDRIAFAAKQLQLTRQGFVPPRVLIGLWRDVIGKLGRIACFTEIPLNAHMWSKYAKWTEGEDEIQGGGICIGFESPDWRLIGLAPVTYPATRPTVNLVTLHENQSQLRDAMFVKTKQWEPEGEWRVFLHFHHTDIDRADLARLSRIAFDQEREVPEVLIGPHAPACVVDRILNISARRQLALSVTHVVEVDGHLTKVAIN